MAAIVCLLGGAACRGPESFSASFAGGAGGAVDPGTGGVDGTGGSGGIDDASGGAGGQTDGTGGQVDATGGSAGGGGNAGSGGHVGGEDGSELGSADGPVNHCDRAHWTATASVSGSMRPPGGAIDGDLETRWSTARNQDGTDWYQVDFGGVVQLSGITLNNTKAFPGDYPGGYAVHVSTDGTQFSGPIASGAGALNMTVIHFTSRPARFVRINQTGLARSMFWWQIAEFQPDCTK